MEYSLVPMKGKENPFKRKFKPEVDPSRKPKRKDDHSKQRESKRIQAETY